MEITGTVEVKNIVVEDRDQEFTVEIDTDEVWREIEDSVTEAAYEVAREAAREEIQNADFGIDYGEGASDLLNEYTPGRSCSLGQAFETAVQGAVDVGDWLKERIAEAVNETAVTAVNPDGVRAMVREEIRLALTAVASQMTAANSEPF